MNGLKFDSNHGIISDSFLRSYSLSRIVKINEENRNKAKVIIMKKMRSLNQEMRRAEIYSPFKSRDESQKGSQQIHPKNIKEKPDQIGTFKPTESRFKKKKAFTNQLKGQIPTQIQLPFMEGPEKLASMKRTFHRRFKSDAFQSPYSSEHQSINIRPKVNSQQRIKAQLRFNQIKFLNSDKKRRLAQKNISSVQKNKKESLSSMSTTMHSFNRLKLIKNGQESQKILHHFYKRTLQNCTFEELKQLIKMQAKRKQELQAHQNTAVTPMKYGKTQIPSKSYTTPLHKQSSIHKNIEEKKSVWKNQVLRESCAIRENNSIVKFQHKKSNFNSINNQTLNKEAKRLSKQQLKSRSKRSSCNKQSLTEMDTRESQMQVNLVYYYKNKRFPINENKLSGVYDKWQKEYIKKKKIQEFITNSNFKGDQLRQLKVNSIKFNKVTNQGSNFNKEEELNQQWKKPLYIQQLQCLALDEKGI